MGKERAWQSAGSGPWTDWVWPQTRESLGLEVPAEEAGQGFQVDGNIFTKVSYLFNTGLAPRPAFPDAHEFLTIPMTAAVGRNAWGIFALNVRKDPFAWRDQSGSQTNIPFSVGEMDFNFPFQAGFSFGSPGWNLQWARAKLKFGPGRTENLLLGPGAGAQDYLMFQGYNDWFRIHLAWVNLDNFKPALEPDPDYGFYLASPDVFTGESKYYSNHGLEFRFGPQFRFGVGEAFVFTSAQADFKYFNPLLLYHNYFFNNSNSDMYFQAEYRPVAGHRIYGQFLIDYMKTWFKSDVYKDTRPGAFGYMLGYEWAFRWTETDILLGLEGMYSDPYLYHDANLPLTGQRRVNSNYFGKNGETSGSRLIDYPLGWSLGPDTLQGALYLDLRNPVFQEVSLSYTFRGKGENTIRTPYPENTEEARKKANELITPSGTPEWTHDAGVSMNYRLGGGFSVGWGAGVAYVMQEGHHPGRNTWNGRGEVTLEWKWK